MKRVTRDGTVEPVLRDKISGTNGNREKLLHPVELTTSTKVGPIPVPVDSQSARSYKVMTTGEINPEVRYISRFAHSIK